MSKNKKLKEKQPEYIEIDIGNALESKEARIKKILDQIPKGKAIVIPENINLNPPPNKIILRIIDPEDIPKPKRQKKHMPPEIKRTLIKAGFRNVTKTGKKRK
jgi:hypothetical protein